MCLPDKDNKAECSETQVTLKMIDGIVETKTVKAKGNFTRYLRSLIFKMELNLTKV